MPAPPPPPAAPPPPTFSAPKSGGGTERDALLKSIQKGAKLKKATTNDRSAPLVGGGSRNTSNNRTPTKHTNNENSHANTFSSMKNFGSIQMELKRQLANSNDTINRGPPPPAPNRNLSDSNFQRQPLFRKENDSNGIHHSQLALNTSLSLAVNHSTLHRKAKSNANLSTLHNNDDANGYSPTRPVVNHGKPNLAPKPPQFNGKHAASKSASLGVVNRPALNRAHSMKTAARSPPQSPVDATNPVIKFGTVRHMSSILSQTLGGPNHGGQQSSNRQRPMLNGRPTAPPPSVPQQPPPLPPFSTHPLSPSQSSLSSPGPPPLKINVVKHPNHAPPPPPPAATIPQAPSHAPPPPPHKTLLQTPSRHPPNTIPSLTINSTNGAPPPPPPPRHSSMKESCPSPGSVPVVDPRR